MNLYIDKKYNQDFVYNYIPKIILELLNNCNKSRFIQINQALNIDSLSIIRLSVVSLIKSYTDDSYILSINKNIKIEDESLDKLVNGITYGNRSVKGYPILLDIFNYITKNIDQLYER